MTAPAVNRPNNPQRQESRSWRHRLLEHGIDTPPDLDPRRFVLALFVIVLIAGSLRTTFLTADPPWHTSVGVTWHDEGAWVHNARNRALFGVWRLDEWNPVFIAPVFTALEYASFTAFGVGTWQGRIVSAGAGLISVLLLGVGIARLGGRRSGAIAAALLATNYVHVMFSRAALMEATMVAFIVAAWYCCVRGEDDPRWGALAGVSAVAAYFTKASAAFFVAALILDVVLSLLPVGRGGNSRDAHGSLVPAVRLAFLTIVGLIAATGAALLLFAGPHWREYQFYNWQVSVTRKPSYTIGAMIDRASWFPIIHDFFTRMWLVTLLAVSGGLSMLATWRTRRPGERLLLLWIGLGVAELVVHDVGNERRLVFLVPALAALAALVLGRDRRVVDESVAHMSRRFALFASPLMFYALYVAFGAIVRLAFLYHTQPGVRWSAVLAVVAGVAILATWPRVPRVLAQERWRPAAALVLTTLIVAGDLAQFAQWAMLRSYKNVSASRALGTLLPEGTLVHGKLANGLALENRIKPVFVGRGFGNYADRTTRNDIRYLLTYISPRIGYEGEVIRDVLGAYPNWRIVRTFDVAETPGGHDKAALVDKMPAGRVSAGADPVRSRP